MENKIGLKKYLLVTFLISVGAIILFVCINEYEAYIYRKNTNGKIGAIIGSVINKYPEVTEDEIIEIVNRTDNNNDYKKILKKYGIDYENEYILDKNNRLTVKFLVIKIVFLVIVIGIIVCIFLVYNGQKDKELGKITNYIQRINKKEYALDIDEMSEDELSILKNEVYKTTVMLKEIASNTNKDKLQLKHSLEDISHQLKTPLTSILVMLDNLIDDEDMDKSIRNEFLRDIKRDVTNINFLVQAILKLSKFDANTINFIKSDKLLKEIVDEAIKNVSALCDLRNISIDVESDDNAKINCDFKWQVEAITNILKNCIEHSNDSSKIDIKCSENSVYAMISIRDYGEGISKEDLPHIFERFYKSANSSEDSVGIGLCLAKTIIEEDKGSIFVESDYKGTIFTIKYYYI